MDNVTIVESIENFEKVCPILDKISIYHQDPTIIRLIGFDCEMISKNNLNNIYDNYLKHHLEVIPYNDIIICKIIIYTEGLCIIIDLVKMNLLPPQLIDILKNDSWIKTGVGISNDFIILSHNYSLGMIVGCIELKNIGILCGIQTPNLLDFYKIITNDNKMSKSRDIPHDWTQELTLSQIKYACNDGYMSYIIGKKILQQLCPIITNIIKQNSEINIFPVKKGKISPNINSNEQNLSDNDLFENYLNNSILIEKIDSSNINYIGKLQEHSQKNNFPLPKYNEDISDQLTYIYICTYQGQTTKGIGNTKKEAKQNSANAMYIKIQNIL